MASSLPNRGDNLGPEQYGLLAKFPAKAGHILWTVFGMDRPFIELFSPSGHEP
jgi:hypothetical protein